MDIHQNVSLFSHKTIIQLPFWCNAEKEFKVDSWHRARKHRKIFFVEQVIDGTLQRQFRPFRGDSSFECEIAHEIGREFTRERNII